MSILWVYFKTKQISLCIHIETIYGTYIHSTKSKLYLLLFNDLAK